MTEILAGLVGTEQAEIEQDWLALWARTEQKPPCNGSWRNWLLIGGRGAGKTRAGAEWVKASATGLGLPAGARARHIALVAPNFDEARIVMIEGVSGLLTIHDDSWRPVFEPSKRQLTWPNGAIFRGRLHDSRGISAALRSARPPQCYRPRRSLNVMQVTEEGLALIKQFEGFRAHAYRCPAGVWTIGYGHTAAAGPPAVAGGMVISRAVADMILRRDVNQFASEVAASLRVTLDARQFSALVSFAYNVGVTNFRKSSVLAAVNGGDLAAVPRRLQLWNKSKGRVLPGLVKRRAVEAEMFVGATVEAPSRSFWQWLLQFFRR